MSNSPEDKRKIVQIGDTSTKFHLRDPFRAGNNIRLKSTLDPNRCASYWSTKSSHMFCTGNHRVPNSLKDENNLKSHLSSIFLWIIGGTIVTKYSHEDLNVIQHFWATE